MSAAARTEPGPLRPTHAAPRLVPLGDAAPGELLALSDAANWNQTEEDWRTMLSLSLGLAWGLRVQDPQVGAEVLAASTVVLPYQGEGSSFAWISMVLVLPQWRGRGFAASLLRCALVELAARPLRPVLDATPAGHAVYSRQDFVDCWRYVRWRRQAAAAPPLAAAARGPMVGIRVRRATDWPEIQALDAPAFGADRTALLRTLARRLPQAAWVAEKDGALRAYLMGRDGRTALQLGPLVADDERTALALIQAALPAVAATAAASGRDVIMDLRDGCRGIAAWLQGQGFVNERPFTRMVHAPDRRADDVQAPGDAKHIVLVAGPEFG